MHYLVAILGLTAFCIAWYLVQRWAGVEERAGCAHARDECGDCELRDPAPPPASPSAPSREMRGAR